MTGCYADTETVVTNHVLRVGQRKFGQDSTEVTVKIFNEGTGLVLPVIYTFTCGKKYTRTDIGETSDFLRLLLSLNLEKKWGCTLIRACTLNRTNSVTSITVNII